MRRIFQTTCAGAIELVDVANARHFRFFGIAPVGLDCGSTPATPSKTTTAPSRTRIERFTSEVKSMCPGVSMILKRTFCECRYPCSSGSKSGDGSGGDGDAALALLFHPVGHGVAFVHFADFVRSCRCNTKCARTWSFSQHRRARRCRSF
jgi:hypothetical protein